MNLIVNVLETNLTQLMTSLKAQEIVHIRPKILNFNNPTGNIKVQVLDSNGNLKDESSTVDISTIGTDDYFHGHVTFNLAAGMLKDEAFQVRLVAGGGYSFSESAYIAWEHDFDHRKYTANFTPNDGVNSPLDMEIWEKKAVGMARVVDFSDGFESSAAPSGDTQFDIANNTGATAVTGLDFSTTDVQAVTIGYTSLRRTDSSEKREAGTLKIRFKPDANAWDIERETNFDTDVGLTFTVTGTTTAQINVASNDLTGANYDGYMRFAITERFAPGV